MDMAVANLFKHKIKFTLDRHDPEYEEYEPETYRKERYYFSTTIANAISIGVNDANDLGRLLKPFILHILSTIEYEERLLIEEIYVAVEITNWASWGDEYTLISYRSERPYSSEVLNNINMFLPDHILQEPFTICVNVCCYFISDNLRDALFRQELASRIQSIEEYHYTPPDETFRQERCVICLEATPSILYLDCRHIAVCGSCDRIKSNTRLRSTCDICRAEISRRIKI